MFSKIFLQGLCSKIAFQKISFKGSFQRFRSHILQRLSSTSLFYIRPTICSNTLIEEFAQILLQWFFEDCVQWFHSKILFNDCCNEFCPDSAQRWFSKIRFQRFCSRISSQRLFKEFVICAKIFLKLCSNIFTDFVQRFFQIIFFTFRGRQHLQWLSKPCLLAFCVYISYHAKLPLL